MSELTGDVERRWQHFSIAKVYRLADVREAYRDLAQRHTRAKIVLVP